MEHFNAMGCIDYKDSRLIYRYPRGYRGPQLFFTIGTARSGKSTFANKWVRFFDSYQWISPENFRPRVIIANDDIEKAIHNNRFNKHAQPLIFSVKQIQTKALLLRGHDILLDDTHTTRESLKRIIEIDLHATPIIFATPLEVCLQRAQDTNQHDLLDVIPRHYRQIQSLLDYGIEKVLDEIVEEVKERWPNR